MSFKCVAIKIAFFEEIVTDRLPATMHQVLTNEGNKTGIHECNPLNRTNLFACWRKPCLPFWMTYVVYCCPYR